MLIYFQAKANLFCKEIRICPELSAMNASNAAHAQILARLVQLQKAIANTLSIPNNASIAELVRTVAPSAQLPKRNQTKTKNHTLERVCDFFCFCSDIAPSKSDIASLAQLWKTYNAHLFKEYPLTVCAYSGLEAQGADRSERQA